MTKTLEKPDPQLDTTPQHPSTISELAAYFIRGESWVKHSKNTLREAYWWMTDQLFDESGSLTGIGFQRMQQLFDKTANTRIVTKRGRRVGERRKPEMSVEDFKVWVWTTHRKFPPDRPIETFAEEDANPVADQEVVEVEFVETETNAYDPSAQVEENTALILNQSALSHETNQNAFNGSLTRLQEFIASQVEHAIVSGITQGQNRGMVKAVETLENGLDTDVKPVKATRKKSTAGKSS